jgi:hypothetical protein
MCRESVPRWHPFSFLNTIWKWLLGAETRHGPHLPEAKAHPQMIHGCILGSYPQMLVSGIVVSSCLV